jgi:hypothetical protein
MQRAEKRTPTRSRTGGKSAQAARRTTLQLHGDEMHTRDIGDGIRCILYEDGVVKGEES